jgi:phage terminase small subunit
MKYNNLTPRDAAFLMAYKAANFNGRKAWQTIKPTASENSAKASAWRILKKPEVIKALEELKQDNISAVNKKISYSKAELHEDTTRIMRSAEEEKQFSAAVKCVELKARTERLFDDDTDDSSKYTMFIQSISNNNININQIVQNKENIKQEQEVLCEGLHNPTQSDQITTETIVE